MPETNTHTVATATATVLSIYRDCEDLFFRIKKKRVDSNWPGPSKSLEDSLRKADQEIRGQQKLGTDRFGDAFLTGDIIAEDALNAVVQDLRIRLLKDLFLALQDDTLSVGAPSCEVSNDARMRILMVLAELYERLAREEESAKTPPIPPLSSRRRMSSLAPEVVPDSSMPVNMIPTRPSMESRYASRSSSCGAQASPSPRAENPSYLPQFSWFKRKSKSKEKGTNSTTSPPALSEVVEGNEYFQSPEDTPLAEQPDAQEYFGSSRVSTSGNASRRYTGPLSPMSPMLGSEMDTDLQKSYSLPSTSDGAGMLPSYDSGCGTVSSMESTNGTWRTLDSGVSAVSGRTPTVAGAQRTLLRLPKADNNFLGFCKGAAAMQRGDENAFKEQREMAFGKVTYKMCAHCAFTGRVSTTKVWTTDGVRFRWAFLAKSHVHQTKVKDHVHAYLCMFCLFLGSECAVTQGSDAFIRHTATHRGEEFTEALLDRIRCINDRAAADEEDFDLNLLPGEGDAFTRKKSAFLSDSLMDAAPVSSEALAAYPGPARWDANFSWPQGLS